MCCFVHAVFFDLFSCLFIKIIFVNNKKPTQHLLLAYVLYVYVNQNINN